MTFRLLRILSSLPSLLASVLASGCNERASVVPPPAASSAASSSANVTDESVSEEAMTESGEEGDETALPSSPREVGDGSPGALLREVDRELRQMRASSYVHRTAIDESRGTFGFDCSAFVGYALSGAAPAAWREVESSVNANGGRERRPLAKHLQVFFSALPASNVTHWKKVGRISDLESGDVIAWLKPDEVSSKNTGHVMIVHGRVAPFEERPGAFLVSIADSTSLRHGRGDSRQSARTTGLGTGTIVLFGDASGAPIAYRWSLGSRAAEHSCAIAIGRLTPG